MSFLRLEECFCFNILASVAFVAVSTKLFALKLLAIKCLFVSPPPLDGDSTATVLSSRLVVEIEDVLSFFEWIEPTSLAEVCF